MLSPDSQRTSDDTLKQIHREKKIKMKKAPALLIVLVLLAFPVCASEFQDYYLSHNLAPMPEPATLFLLGFGLIGLGAIGKKRFKKDL